MLKWRLTCFFTAEAQNRTADNRNPDGGRRLPVVAPVAVRHRDQHHSRGAASLVRPRTRQSASRRCRKPAAWILRSRHNRGQVDVADKNEILTTLSSACPPDVATAILGVGRFSSGCSSQVAENVARARNWSSTMPDRGLTLRREPIGRFGPLLRSQIRTAPRVARNPVPPRLEPFLPRSVLFEPR